MEPKSTEGTSSDNQPLSTLEQARLEWQALSQQQPEETWRDGQDPATSPTRNSQDQPSITRSSKVPPSSEVVTVDPPKELLEPPTADPWPT